MMIVLLIWASSKNASWVVIWPICPWKDWEKKLLETGEQIHAGAIEKKWSKTNFWEKSPFLCLEIGNEISALMVLD